MSSFAGKTFGSFCDDTKWIQMVQFQVKMELSEVKKDKMYMNYTSTLQNVVFKLSVVA